MSTFITLWLLSIFATGIVLTIRSLLGYTKPVEEPRRDAPPPDPGGFDARRLRTQQQQNEWLQAYSRRVAWERARPRRPIPPPRERVYDKSVMSQ